jgi:hypothetical protein
MNERPSPEFAARLREELLMEVASTKRARRRSFRPVALAATAVLGVAGGGAGVAVATDLVSLPGTDIVTETTGRGTATGTGSGSIPLDPPSAGATHLSIQFTCVTPGSFTLADGAFTTCHADDIGTEGATMFHRLELPVGASTSVTTDRASASWSAVVSYVEVKTTEWEQNDNGDSYGAVNNRGEPDLIAVIATNGREGYVYADAMDGPESTSPEEALTWQEEHAGEVVSLPVFLADGETQIGEFVLAPTTTSTLPTPAP